MVAAVMVVVMVRSSSRLLRRTAGLLSTSLDAVGRRPHATTVARCSTSSPVSSGMGDRVLTMDTLNPHVRAMEYAVRGPIVIRAAQIDRELQQVLRRGFKQDPAGIACSALLDPLLVGSGLDSPSQEPRPPPPVGPLSLGPRP